LIRFFFHTLFITFLFISCTPKQNVSINRYTYSDSIVHVSDDSLLKLNFLSESEICLLSTPTKDSHTDKVVESINRSILALVAPNYINDPFDSICKHQVDASLVEMYESTMSRIDSFNFSDSEESESYDSITYDFYNKLITDCRIGLGDSIICYTVYSSSYISGAHPFELSYAYSFSLKDGSRIYLNKVISSSDKSKMLKRIISKLIKQEQVRDEEELHSLGFEVNQISDNILLDKDSITFHYDTYSIAPYTYGEIDVKFSYDEVSDLLIWSRSKND